MFKKFSFMMLAGIFAFSLAGCSDSSSSKDKPKTPPAEMVTLSTDVLVAAQTAMADALNPANQTKGKEIITAAGEGWSARLDYSTDGTTASYDYTFTWSGYTSGEITFSSGEIRIIGTASSAATSYDYTGDFVVDYQDNTYDMSWEISIDVNLQTYATTYTGTFTVDGVIYSWAGSAK